MSEGRDAIAFPHPAASNGGSARWSIPIVRGARCVVPLRHSSAREVARVVGPSGCASWIPACAGMTTVYDFEASAEAFVFSDRPPVIPDLSRRVCQ